VIHLLQVHQPLLCIRTWTIHIFEPPSLQACAFTAETALLHFPLLTTGLVVQDAHSRQARTIPSRISRPAPNMRLTINFTRPCFVGCLN
jgi:hypothetical protein